MGRIKIEHGIYFWHVFYIPTDSEIHLLGLNKRVKIGEYRLWKDAVVSANAALNNDWEVARPNWSHKTRQQLNETWNKYGVNVGWPELGRDMPLSHWKFALKSVTKSNPAAWARDMQYDTPVSVTVYTRQNRSGK